jgi:hypothetical protein
LWSIHLRPDSQFDNGFTAYGYLCGAFMRNHAQTVAAPKEEVALTTDHLPFGLARLSLELRPLALHPSQFSDYG